MPALRLLAEGGASPKVDIVAVHGLNPKGKNVKQHAWDTWRKPSGQQGRLWLRDDLSQSLPEARIFLYEFDSRIFSHNHDTFWDAGNELLDCLRGKRRNDCRRPLILVGHSLGGLLIKQALVNAHDNKHYADIESSVKGLAFFSTPHEGGNVQSAKVKLGFAAARIAESLGFNSNDSIVQALTPGSLFGDFLREAFRHQLENYLIVSFWEKKSTIVTKESATFGLPGHRENILGLEADHSNICKFNTDEEDDRDIYESFVEHNFQWLYEEALKDAFLENRLEGLKTANQSVLQPRDIHAISSYTASVSSEVHVLERALNRSPNDCLDWLLYASVYRSWSRMWQHERRHLPVLWCETDDSESTAAALGQRLAQDGDTIIHMTSNLPLLSITSLDGMESKQGISTLLFLIQQAYMLASEDSDFPNFIVESGIFDRRPDKIRMLSAEAATIFARLLKSDPDRKWTLLIHNADSMHKVVASEIGRLLGRLLEPSSQLRVQFFRVVVCGENTSEIPQLARYSAVVDKTTEYLECVASLHFDNMNSRQNRIISATVGTNHWIWDNPSYHAWKNNQSSAVWICGKAGSGKSVLAKTMQEQLLADSQSLNSLICSWFYSARDNLVFHAQMFKAMLYQILSQDSALFQSVKEVYRSGLSDEDGFSTRHWVITDVCRALEAVFNDRTSQERLVLFVLDGVDESNANDVGGDCSRPEALRFLVHLTKKSTPLKIIFLSRPSDDIRRALRRQLFISMHTVNRPDIVFLIEKGIQSLSRLLDGYESDDEYSSTETSYSRSSSVSGISCAPSIQPEYFRNASSDKEAMLSEIDTYLRVNARGVVLWVTTVLKILQSKCRDSLFYDIASMRSQLDDLPLELTELYSQITVKLIESFKGDEQTLRKARRALMWVSVSSKYMMQLQDLLEVISYDFSTSQASFKPTVFAGVISWPSFKKEIEALCGPFIEVIPVISRSVTVQAPDATKWDSLQLPHESVRTFLQQSKDSLALGFSASEAESRVREERKAYMQRTLPYLDNLLLSRTRAKKLQRYCEYLDGRQLLCFILMTLDLELQYMMSLEGGKAYLANIINQYFTRHGAGDTPTFALISNLFKAIGFLDPNWSRDAQEDSSNSSYRHDNNIIQELIFAACYGGMLNASNALSALLAYPRGGMQKLSIIRGMMDAADEVKLEYDTASFTSLVPDIDHHPADSEIQLRCRISKTNPPSSRSVRVAAAVSQIIDHGIFQGADIGLWTTLAQLQADSLLHVGFENYRLRSLDLKEKSGSTTNFHRTPFTSLETRSSEQYHA